MSGDDVAFLDATELARLIRGREVSPVEVLRALRERANRLNPRLNALVAPIPSAEARAREAEAAVGRGEALGPLHGVPFTVKDCVDTAGVRTARGSLLFADRVPAADATVVARLTAAGAIPIAKTNLPEFALWWETGNRLSGRTVNPWNADRTTGGSSGGEAAALAAGLSPLGIGSDVGGSIRAPAHYCGVVGLKPTHGRVPLTGHWPETLLRYMHVGPMARTVRDVDLALRLMAGPDGLDWYCQPVPLPAPLEPEAGVRGLRVGVLGARGFGPLDPDVAATLERAARALSGLGARVDEARVRALEAHDWNPLTMTLFGGEGRPYFAPIIGGREEELHPVLRRRLGAPAPDYAQYVAVEGLVEDLRRDTLAFFASHDLLICPVVPVPAHPHEADALVIEGARCAPRTALRATIPFDLTGSPALAVPFGWSREGLPIGVQLVGKHFDEPTVLRAGAALEALHDAARRRPPV